jgi:hypothetical protein
MAKHFTRASIANGYAAMGGSLRRPYYPGVRSRSAAEAIAQEKAAAARQAKINSGSKKK